MTPQRLVLLFLDICLITVALILLGVIVGLWL
jgi:hypothetical protein